MTDFAARIQSRLPAKLSDAPAFSPLVGALPAAKSTLLREIEEASLALSAALRDLERTYPHDQLVMRSTVALPVGATIYDVDTTATAAIASVTAADSETPPLWQYTLTPLVGTIRADDTIKSPNSGGATVGTAAADLFPAANVWLAGCARIVGERRGPLESDVLTRARTLARVTVNAGWGRLGDLLGVAGWLWPAGVFLDDGGEAQSSSSAWGTGRVTNGAVLVEAVGRIGVTELAYQAFKTLLKSTVSAGVRLEIGANRSVRLAVFTFGTSAFGDGSVFYSLES